jgi:two-component system response regulator ResD
VCGRRRLERGSRSPDPPAYSPEQLVNPRPGQPGLAECLPQSALVEDHVRGTVLVVDDEPTITEVVARYLERAGYRTRVAADGIQALELAASQRPDLVLLDLMLPGIDGLEVMRRLRELGRDRMAVILLTAKGEESDRVIGLRLGADDYVVKPFSPAELVARVDAVLRRIDTSPGHEAPIELADMTIDPSSRRVFVRGEEVQLTQREFDVLLFLARHPGQVFSRNQLMDAVWQYSFYTDTSTVTVHVRRLRSKIEPDPAQPRHIQTVWGVGYRFQP